MLDNDNTNGDLHIVSHQTVIRDEPRKLGYVSENGFVYDHENILLGYVSQQGNVRDRELRLVGHVNLLQYSFPFEAGKIAFSLLCEQQIQEGTPLNDTQEQDPSSGF